MEVERAERARGRAKRKTNAKAKQPKSKRGNAKRKAELPPIQPYHKDSNPSDDFDDEVYAVSTDPGVGYHCFSLASSSEMLVDLTNLKSLQALLARPEIIISDESRTFIECCATLARGDRGAQFRSGVIHTEIKQTQRAMRTMVATLPDFPLGPKPIELAVLVYLRKTAFQIRSNYDLWYMMTHLTPRGYVRRCPAMVDSIANQVRQARAAGQPVHIDPDVMQCNLSEEALADPNYWYTVPGLLKLVENSGYRATQQPEGLTVELREYQKQTLAWMQDQEHFPGGLNAKFWERHTIDTPVRGDADR